MLALKSILRSAFALASTAGGVVAAVWLLAQGEWRKVLQGFLLSLVWQIVIPKLMIVSPLLTMRGIAKAETSGDRAALPYIAMSNAFAGFVMAGWSWLIIAQIANTPERRLSIPILMWCFSVATALWGWMADRDSDDIDSASKNTVLFGQIGCVVALCALLKQVDFPHAVPVILFGSAAIGAGMLAIRNRHMRVSEIVPPTERSSRDAA